jgi:hypothetical protein
VADGAPVAAHVTRVRDDIAPVGSPIPLLGAKNAQVLSGIRVLARSYVLDQISLVRSDLPGVPGDVAPIANDVAMVAPDVAHFRPRYNGRYGLSLHHSGNHRRHHRSDHCRCDAVHIEPPLLIHRFIVLVSRAKRRAFAVGDDMNQPVLIAGAIARRVGDGGHDQPLRLRRFVIWAM